MFKIECVTNLIKSQQNPLNYYSLKLKIKEFQGDS